MRVLQGLALMAAMLAMPVWADSPLPDGPHVVASGQAKVVVAPDVAESSVSVEINAAQPAEAKRRVDVAINRFLAALHAQGVAEADIEASDLRLSEDIDTDDEGRRASNGFSASRTVEFKLRDIGKLNALLDDALAAGMNRFGDTRFTSSRADALRAEARAKAARNATERARELAAGFGAKLGAVYSINSANNDLGARYRYGATSLDRVEVSGTRAQPGRYLKPEIEYNETVTAVFSIQP